LRGRSAVERAVRATLVVIFSEFSQLAREVGNVPKKYAIQVLAPNRADQPFNERMRHRHVGNRSNLLDIEYPQVGEPTVEAEQRVVIGAEVFR
jgi:hypothetical protein